MMKKMLLFFSTLILANIVLAQVEVTPGEGTLSAAILSAVDGDVLLLAPSGVYTEGTESEFGTIINKSITIKVDGDGTDRAIVKMETPYVDGTTEPEFFVMGDSSSLIFSGIEFDGGIITGTTANTKNFINFTMGDAPIETFINKIDIDNCYIHDLHFDGEVIVAGSQDMASYLVIDSTFINNSIIEKTGTVYYTKYAGSNFFSLTNSTLNTIKSYGIRISGPGNHQLFDNTPTVIIDKTTWYNIGTQDQREILLLEYGPNISPWSVTNSIFVKQNHGGGANPENGKTCINLKETTGDSLATITNIVWWDVGATRTSKWMDHTVSDTMEIDPQFLDPDNGDFTLPPYSPLLSYGTDGGPIGDPRWATNLSVEAGAETLPVNFTLKQNFPNPFNPTTRISFDLKLAGHTALKVYDMLGQEIAILENNVLKKGVHHYSFNAANIPSGIYFYQLISSGMMDTKKMLVIK